MTTCLNTFSRCIAAAALVVILISSSASAATEYISLKLKKGDLIFSGELIAFNGKSYVLKTSNYGHISLDARKFKCITKNCSTLLQVHLVHAKNRARKKKSATPYISYLGNNSPDFGIHGSNTIGSRLMPALIKGFAQRNGYRFIQDGQNKDKSVKITLVRRDGKVVSKIDLRRLGSATAFPSLKKDQAVIGMSDRPINTKEVADLKEAGYPGMQSSGKEHVIGIDGILVVISPKNTLTSLTKKQIAGIFSGEIKNWSEVGGQPGKINIYAPDNKSGTFSTFRSLILKPAKLKISPKAKRYASNTTLSEKVYSDPNSIGITGFAYKGKTKALTIASPCGMIHSPTQFNVSTDEYPLSRRLYLYTTKPIRNKYAAALLNYSKDSASTENILKQNGFIGRGITLQPFHEQNQRLSSFFSSSTSNQHIKLVRQFSKELRKASRLSYTVRFKPNSSDFDSESLQLFNQLGRFIAANKLENNYFVLVGFSDTVGPFDKNLELSRIRAQQVADKFRKSTKSFIKKSQIKVRAYGELLPVACNDTELGKKQNRRVEIWTLKPQHWPVQPVIARPTLPTNQLTLNAQRDRRQSNPDRQ